MPKIKVSKPKRMFHHLSCRCCTTKDPNPPDVKAYDKALAQMEDIYDGSYRWPEDPVCTAECGCLEFNPWYPFETNKFLPRKSD